MMSIAAFAHLALVCLGSFASAGGGGDAEYEWAGIFATPEDEYTWTAQKVEEKYADPAMKLVLMPVPSSSAAELDKVKDAGNTLLTGTCTEVTFGQTMTPATGGKCYKLKFAANMWQSLFLIDTSGVQAVAFFAEHVPTEFEATAHYLKDDHGHDIEPDAELPEAEESEEAKPWGAAIGSSLLVNLVTLLPVILVVPAITKLSDEHPDAFAAIICGFAAGALLSCAFFLLLFEATHLVNTGWETEVEVLWRWGTMILVGYVLPSFIHSAIGFAVDEQTEQTPVAEVKKIQVGCVPSAESEPVPTSDVKDKKDLDTVTRARLIGGVLIGDFFHNLCDGFFVGAAFSGCGSSFGWKVAMATILHEIPQELADFAILVGPEANLGTIKALAANFISGLGVLFGAVIILASEVSDASTGLLLAFGGGVYLHVAATECMPKVYHPSLTPVQNLAALASFILGAILIGLILIGHEHCVPGGGEHAH